MMTAIENKDHQTLPNVLAVLAWLNEHGYAIKKSALYNHIEHGKLRKRKDGTFALSSVEKYADTHLKLMDGTPSTFRRAEKLAEQKAEAEVRKLNAQAARAERQEMILRDGWVERAEMERQLAARAAILKNDIEAWCYATAPEIIKQCAGDAANTEALITWLQRGTAQWMNRYASATAIAVPITAQTLAALNADGQRENDEDDT